MATPQRQERRQSAVVFNPIKVTEAKLRESVNAAAEAAGWAPPIWFPTTEEDPGQRVTASALRRGAEVVIVAGGDGTVRAVASALRDADAAMAIVPAGTGNLLARNLSLPINSVDACIDLAFNGVNHDIDLGLAAIERENGDKEEHAFLVMTGLGIDAKMVANTNTELKKAVGWIAYIDGTVRSIPQLKPIKLRFRLDGAPERGMSAHSIIIGNCGTLPGGIPLLPDALPDDGILDIVALRPRGMFGWFRVWNTLTFDNGVLRKSRVGRKILDLKSDVKDVTYMRAKELTIHVEEPQPFQLDGDEFGTVRAVRAHVAGRADHTDAEPVTEGVVGGPSIEVERRKNNFDALRIIAALSVIVGHSFILTGRPESSPSVAGLPLEYLGVSVFFIISGYLITGSWERSRSVGQYVSSRALRIAPLLFLVVLASTFIMGPIVTTLSLSEYFTSPVTWRYLINLVLLPADALPGVFTDVPYPNVVNGSIWTLRAEVICYAIVLGLGLLPKRGQVVGFVLFGVGSAALVIFGPVIIAGSSLSAAGGTWIYFAIAALIRLLAPRKAFNLGVGAVVFVVWLIVGPLFPEFVYPLGWVALPYVVLSFGFASTPVLHRAARFGDISYGLYLWAFPVQQLVVTYFGVLPVPVNLLLVIVFTAALAFASWHLLEKRALAARFKLPFFTDKKSAV